MLSLAMVIGLAGMSHSMYDSVGEWMNAAFNADFFVSPTPDLRLRNLTFLPEIGPLIERLEGVDQVQLIRSARITYRGGPVMVISAEVSKVAQKVIRVPIAGDFDEMHRLTA